MDIEDEESELDDFKPTKEEKKSASPTKKASPKKESVKKDTPSKKRGKDGKPKEEAKKGKGKPAKDDGKTKMGGEANVKAAPAKLVFMDIPETKIKVEEYMLRHNRPYSVQDILNCYQSTMRRK